MNSKVTVESQPKQSTQIKKLTEIKEPTPRVELKPKHFKERSRAPKIKTVPTLVSDDNAKMDGYNFIRETRINFLGITQLQFSELLEIKFQTYLSYEYGKVKLPEKIREKINTIVKKGLSKKFENTNSYADKNIREIVEIWKNRVGFYEKQMTLFQFTKIIGVSTPTFWRWMTQESRPKKHNLLRYEGNVIDYENKNK